MSMANPPVTSSEPAPSYGHGQSRGGADSEAALIAVIVPVLARPANATKVAASLAAATVVTHRLVFIVSPDDRAQREACEETGATILTAGWQPGPADYAQKCQLGYDLTTEPFIFTGADDLDFQPGWDTAAVEAIETGPFGVCGTNDCANPMVKRGLHSTHSLVRRAYIEGMGGTFDRRPGVLLSDAYDHQYCCPGEAPIWMADLDFKPVGDLTIGDEIIGWERVPTGSFTMNRLRQATVTNVIEREAAVVKVRMESGRTLRCTPDHRWLNFTWSPSRREGHGNEWVTPKVGCVLAHVASQAPELSRDLERQAAWLGGIYDGEGSIAYIGQCPVANPDVYAQICSTLEALDLDYSESADRVWIKGGRDAYLRFLQVAQPVRRHSLVRKILDKSRFTRRDRIVSVEPDGSDAVFSLTTTTGNYVAWGYASKNCDTELVAVAVDRGEFVFARGSRVRHRHPFFDRSVARDATYEKALARGAEDRRLFEARRAEWARTQVAA